MKLTVVHLEGSKQGLTETITGQVLSIGRDPSNALSFDPFKDLDVSSRHAAINLQGGQVMLQDLGSTNGTWLNGQKVQGAVPLANGSMIQFGDNGPKIKVNYTLEEGPGKKTRMIADLGAQLEEEQKKSEAEQQAGKKKLTLFACCFFLVAALGVGGFFAFSHMQKTETLEQEITELRAQIEVKQPRAAEQNAEGIEASKADWENANAALAKADEAAAAGDLGEARDRLKEAVGLFEEAEHKAGTENRKALEQQMKDAVARAEKEKQQLEARRKKEREQMEALARKKEEEKAASKERLEAAKETAALKEELSKIAETKNPEQLKQAVANLEARLAELPADSPERAELEKLLGEMQTSLEEAANVGEQLTAAAKAAKLKIVAIRTKVFAIPAGQRLDTTKIRIPVAEGFGTGFFAAADGRIVTAKEVVEPELFDLEALARRTKLEEKGVQFFRDITVLVRQEDGTYAEKHASPDVTVGRRFDDSWGESQKVTIEFDNAETEVEVKPHERGDSDVVVLKVEGLSDVPFLELAENDPAAGQPMVLLGTQYDESEALGLYLFDGSLSAGGPVMTVDTPSFPSWIGGPALDPNGKVLGLLVAPDLEKSRAVAAGVVRPALE